MVWYFILFFLFQNCSNWKWTISKFSSLVSSRFCFILAFHWQQFLSRLPSFDSQHTNKYSMYPRCRTNKKNPSFYTAKPMEIPSLRKTLLWHYNCEHCFDESGMADLFHICSPNVFRNYFTWAFCTHNQKNSVHQIITN